MSKRICQRHITDELRDICLRINQVPNASYKGAVFPSKVAFEAVVKLSDDVHSARSPAVHTPASNGNQTAVEVIAAWPLARGIKKGRSKNIEKKIR